MNHQAKGNPDAIRIKQDIIERYEREAGERDQEGWYSRDSSERVPESKSAHYFIDRKVQEALQYCLNDHKLTSGYTPRESNLFLPP